MGTEWSSKSRDKWRPQDDQTVIRLYPMLGMQLAEQMPWRTPGAIKQRASRLGVAVRKRRRWTPDDDAQLSALYASTSATDIAAIIGRTPDAVLERARQLGVRKHRLRHARG